MPHEVGGQRAAAAARDATEEELQVPSSINIYKEPWGTLQGKGTT